MIVMEAASIVIRNKHCDSKQALLFETSIVIRNNHLWYEQHISWAHDALYIRCLSE